MELSLLSRIHADLLTERKLKNDFIGLFLLFLGVAPAFAATGEPLDLQTRHGHYHTTFVINKDGTAVESREWSTTILKESAIEQAKRSSISYSTSAQHAEVLAAYTKKPDGRRIDAPKDNYQIQTNSGNGKDSPVYSDITTLTVVFPDVAVGDTVVLSYRLTQTEPLFQGHFTTAETFPRQVAFDDIRVRIEYPASLWVQYDARGMAETENLEKAGRKVVEWRHANPEPVRSERRDFSVFDPDEEVGIAFSTFKSYADIAAAYGSRATPKAAVTERIRKLAAEIVKEATVPREQARALYDWVATNVDYAGNCIGIGAVVPRDLSFVLDNRLGDCKDHATLLQSLLAARGIRSMQALVNAGSIYKLPKIPVVSTVNHVINFIPELDLYVDSTAEWVPFGMLPFEDQGKPVLLVEGFRDGARTPSLPADANQQRIDSILKLGSDGSISGTVEVTQKGLGAAQTRAWARNLTKEWEKDFVKNAFLSQGMIGSGTFEKDDPAALADTYRFKTTINVEKFVKVPGAGAFHIYPLTTAGSILNAIRSSMDPEKEADVACLGGKLTEDYRIELPNAMKVLSVPDDLKFENDMLAYSASYELRGKVLAVKRVLDDRTKGNVCSPQTMAAYKKYADQVLDNLKEQVLYK